MNPYLNLFAGALRGYSAGKRRKEEIAMMKAKKPLIDLQIKRQQLMNSIVENYLSQMGYGQAEMPGLTEAAAQAPAAPEMPEYKPVYRSTKSIMEEMGRPMAGTEQAPTQAPGIPQAPRPGMGQDLMGAAMIQQMSGGMLPLFDLAKEQQRQKQWQKTEERLTATSQRDYEQRESALSGQPVTIDGRPYIQPVDRYQRPVGEPYAVGEKKGISSSEASKLKLAEQGKIALDNIIAAVINKDGSINESLLFSKALSKYWPGFKGAEIRQWSEEAIEARLRLVSGAAITKEDIKTAASVFEPKYLDRPEVIKNKLYSLRKYLNGVTEAVDPNKTYSGDTLFFTNNKGEKFAMIPQDETNAPSEQNFFNSIGIAPKAR